MPFERVQVVFDPSVRGLCAKPYPGHPKGCPNFNKKPGCPLGAPLFWDVCDINKPVVAFYNFFDLTAHVERMRTKHPDWSERQLSCCLYWQAGARKKLKAEIERFHFDTDAPHLQVIYCPEAMGVNVTATMKSADVQLEWPPKNRVVQVALVAWRKT